MRDETDRSLAGQARRVLASRWDVLLVIAAGGAIGSLARWALVQTLGRRQDSFPWATFLENVTGAFALGALMVLVLDVWPASRYVRPFVGIGVLGGYTTFSTYVLDVRGLVAADRPALAAAYLFGTLAGGIFAVWLGVALARLLVVLAARRRRRHHSDAHHDHHDDVRSQR